jgi:DNA-directed RNA polymerase specialized sigma subunit
LSVPEIIPERRQTASHAELWQKYFIARSNDIRNTLVLAYRPPVTMVVKMLLPNPSVYWDRDDMESLGVFGLIDSIARWEPLARFEAYAVARIRGTMHEGLSRLDRHARRYVVAYIRASDELVARTDGESARRPARIAGPTAALDSPVDFHCAFAA